MQNSKHLLAAAVAAVGLAGFGTSQAQGGLFVELRALTVTGGPGNTIVPGGKTVILGSIDGRTITMGVYARISGTNTAQQVIDINGDGSDFVTVNDDTLQDLVGAFSSTGTLHGNMGSAVGVAGPNSIYNPTFGPFNASGASNGAFADFDSDGDLDLGAIGTDPTNMWAARAAEQTLGAKSSLVGKGYSQRPYASFVPNSQDSLIDATTSEVRVGTLRFIATSGGGPADIQFIIRQNGDGAALWIEDNAGPAKNPTNSTFTVGAPVIINPLTPEPSAASLIALSSLGLLARRKRGCR